MNISRRAGLLLGSGGILAACGHVQADSRLPDFTAIFEQQSPAVVSVTVSISEDASPDMPQFDFDQLPEPWRYFFEPPEDQHPSPRRGQGFGSGFILSGDGYVVTNAHVVNNATDIEIKLQDQREYTAELVGADTLTDIALLKVDAGDLPSVTLGDSDDVKVGQWVLAIGAPFGFDYTATQGIVSAIARSLPSETYVPFIQTDVAVNPGNSGGPLLDADGKVIGVNSQIYSRSGGYQGLSFAIPVNVVKNAAAQIRERGYVSRGWLGVTIQSVSQDLADSFDLKRPTGALVASVAEGSPAEQAGLKTGDIILEFNGRPVTTSTALPPMVGVVPVGTTVPLKILRDGKEQSITVTIAELDTQGAEPRATSRSGGNTSNLGLAVANLDAAELKARGLDHGVVINAVAPGTPAAVAGLQAGDVLLSLNRQTVSSVRVFHSIVAKLPADKAIPVLIQRGDSALFLVIKKPLK